MKKFFLIFIFFFYLLISYYYQGSKKSYQKLSKNYPNNQAINLNDLSINLLKADKKFIPKLIRNKDGSSTYSYLKIIGEEEISLDEIKYRLKLGTDFYKNDREKVINLLMRINQLNINNKLESIDSGALGLWIPSDETIIIDYRVVEMGSAIFHEVLSHEVIHVAQSCFSGSRKNFPERIGLPLEFSSVVDLNLSHNLYNKKSEEVINLEREAFTYSKVEGAAIKLLNNYC